MNTGDVVVITKSKVNWHKNMNIFDGVLTVYPVKLSHWAWNFFEGHFRKAELHEIVAYNAGIRNIKDIHPVNIVINNYQII